MRWAYAIAFEGNRFLMVWNPKRIGWEMPGGHVEEGESGEEAVIREFREECGQEFLPLAAKHYQGGAVFAGKLQVTGGSGEMRWELFEELPRELSFIEAEYVEEIRWGRRTLELNRN
ncbi:MAG: NUDIX hydrolase [Methanomassiliicoccales archaeon]